MEKDEQIELQLREEEAVKVKCLLEHPGWVEVIEPAIKLLRESAITQLIGGKLDQDLIRQQELVKIIDWLRNHIKTVLAVGLIASQQLEEERGYDADDESGKSAD